MTNGLFAAARARRARRCTTAQQRPGVAAVGRRVDADAFVKRAREVVEGVSAVEGVSCTCVQRGRTGVEGERSHRERILGVHFRNPRRAAVGRFPYTAVIGRKIKRLIRRSRRIDDDADHLTCDRTDALILLHRVDAQRCRADLLPRRAQRDSFGRRCNAHALRLLHAFDPQVGTHFARCIAANILIASVPVLPQRPLDAVATLSSRRVHVSLRPCSRARSSNAHSNANAANSAVKLPKRNHTHAIDSAAKSASRRANARRRSKSNGNSAARKSRPASQSPTNQSAAKIPNSNRKLSGIMRDSTRRSNAAETTKTVRINAAPYARKRVAREAPNTRIIGSPPTEERYGIQLPGPVVRSGLRGVGEHFF